eukprot:2945171-Prymnesium_polylepis.1
MRMRNAAGRCSTISHCRRGACDTEQSPRSRVCRLPSPVRAVLPLRVAQSGVETGAVTFTLPLDGERCVNVRTTALVNVRTTALGTRSSTLQPCNP